MKQNLYNRGPQVSRHSPYHPPLNRDLPESTPLMGRAVPGPRSLPAKQRRRPSATPRPVLFRVLSSSRTHADPFPSLGARILGAGSQLRPSISSL